MSTRQLLENPMLAAAVENARHGLAVYPVRPRDKKPLHKGWQRSATVKVEHLARVWKHAPAANVGIACRDVVVLDADSQRGEDAVADLGLPPTTTVRTARGTHNYFAGKAPTIAGLLPEVELRGRGSGVLGAGSIHPSGRDYEWEIPPWEIPPVPLPDELRELIDQHRGTTGAQGTTGGYVLPGRRNHELTRFAGALRGRYGIGELAPVLHEVNRTWCRPPLPENEVEKIAGSASRWQYPPLWVADPVTYCCADPRLSLLARVILRHLCDHAKDDGTAYPGMRRLGELTKTTRRRIIAALEELEAAKRIAVRRSRRGNRYRLLPWRPLEELFPHKGGSSGSHVGTTDADTSTRRAA